MGSPNHHRALLLGLVEVTRPVSVLDEEARARVFTMCHTASTAGHVKDPAWLGRMERGFMGVEIILDQQHFHINSNEVLVSRHSLREMCAVMRVQTTEGHVVFVGRCQVKGLRLAVVLDMMSQMDAQQLQDDVQQRLFQVASLSAGPSTPQDNKSPRLISKASPLSTTSDSEQDPSTVHSDRPSSSDTQHANNTPAYISASPLVRPKTLPHRVVVRTKALTEPPHLPTKPVLSKAPTTVTPPPGKPPLPNMCATATPLCLVTRSPVSRVATPFTIAAPVSSPVSTRLVAIPKVVTSQLSTSTVSTPTVSTPTVSTPTVSTPTVSTPTVFTPTVSTSTVSTPTVSNPTVSNPTRPVFTPLVSARPLSTPTVSARPVSTPLVSAPQLVSSPLVSTPRVCTTTVSSPILSTLTVSGRPMSTLISNRLVTIPKVSIRPLSFPKAVTPLASIQPVSTQPVSTSTVSTSYVSTPKVSTRPVSILKAFTQLVSTTPVSTSTVSTSTISTNPVTTSTESITLVSTPVVTSLPVSVSSSVPPVTIVSSSVRSRRSSIASASSQDEESNISEKIKLLFGALKVEESEDLHIPGLQPSQKQYVSDSVEQELCNFLENEYQYLNTLVRIKEARKVLTSELQNLLKRSDRLVDFHYELYQDLHQQFPSSSGMAQVFLSHKEELDQYRYYLMDAPQVASHLGKRTDGVVKQHPTLEADIKLSWKRLHFYFMTFERLVKIVPTEEQQLLQKVVDLLRETNRQGDSGILIDAVSGAPFSLHTLGMMVLHGLFTIKDSSGVLSSRLKYHVLLFEEVMVVVLPKKEKYQYKDHFPVRQLNLLTQLNSDDATFILELVQGGNKKKRKYTFRPRQQEVKDVWMAEMSRLHLKYEEEVERLRKLRSGY